MSSLMHVGLNELTSLQTAVMKFIAKWVHEEKTPIPQKEIVANLAIGGYKDFTTVNALNSLCRKGYIRQAVTISHKRYYVQLRGI